MSCRTKISAIVKLISLVIVSLFSLEVVTQAQTYWMGVKCYSPSLSVENTAVYLFSDGESQGSSVDYSKSGAFGKMPVQITARMIYADGTSVDLTSAISDNPKSYFYCEYNGKNGISRRLINLVIYPKNNMPSEYFGQTLEFTVVLGTGEGQVTEVFQVEIVGPPEVENASSDFQYSDDDGYYETFVCKDDVFTIAISNSDRPYATTESNVTYKGTEYVATYSWRLLDGNTGVTSTYTVADPKSFTVTDMTSSLYSNAYLFTPIVNVNGCSAPMTDFAVYYTAPIVTTTSFNGVVGNSFVICDEDNGEAKFSFVRDDFPYSDVKIELTATNDQNSEVLNFGSDEGSDELTFDLGQLKSINNKNTLYTFSYKTTDLDEYGANCTESGTFQVLVKEKKATITMPTLTDICEGGTIYPTASVSGESYSDYTFAWKFGDTQFASAVSGSYTFAEGITGDQTLTFIVSNDGCEISETTTVHINALPIVTPSADVEICRGESTTLEVTSDQATTAGTEYAWTPSGGELTTSGDQSSYVVSPYTTTIYKVVGTNKDTGCTSKEKSVTVTVNPLPYVTSITPSSWSVCQIDQSVVLQAATDDGTGSLKYNWSWSDIDGDHAETTTTSSLKINSINADTPVKIYLKLVDEKGCVSELDPDYSIELTMNQKPEVNVDDFTMCDGTTGSADITNYDPSYTYTVAAVTAGAPAVSYSSGKCYVNSEAGIGITAVTKYTYRITATTTSGCSTTDDFVVTMSPMPNITANSDKSLYCYGESVELSASSTTSNVSYSWRDASDNEIATTANKTLSSLAVGVYTYTMVITNKTTGCESRKDVTFSVVDIPTKPIISASRTSICSGDADKSVTLSVANVESGVTYSWYDQTNAMLGTGNSINHTPTATTTYHVIGKNVNNCESALSETITIDYYQSPVIAAKGATSFNICKNNTQELAVTTTSTSDLVYHWSDGTETTTGTHEVTPSSTTTYEVYAEDQTTHCVSNTISFTVNVYSIGDIVVTPAAQDVCIGNEATVTVKVTPWTEDDNHILTINQYDGFGSIDKQYELTNGAAVSFPIVAGHTYGVYALVINGDLLCWDKVDAGLTIYEEPDFTITGNEEVCVGGSLTLTPNITNPLGTYTYQWYHGSVLVGTNETLTLSGVTVADAGEYSLTISAPAADCSTTKSVNVVVNALPVPTISAADRICSSGSATISTTESYASYVWNVNDGSDITTPTLEINGNDYTPGTSVNVKVVVTDSKGCVSSQVSKNVYVKQNVVITDAVSTKDLSCIGSSVTLSPTVTPAATYTYKWQESTGAIDLSSKNGASITIDDLKYPSSGSTYTVTVTATDEDNCSSSFDYTINMYKVEVEVDGSTSACNNTTEPISWTASASVNPAIAATYTYDFALYNSSNVLVNSVSGQTSNVYTLSAVQVQALAEGNYTIVAKAHANIGGGSACEGTSEAFNLKINAKPDATLTSNMPTCIGDEIVFTAVAGYDSYSFSVNGVEVQNGSDNTYSSSTLSAGDLVTVTVASSTCQETSEVATVSYLSEFAPTVSIANVVTCKGSSATLIATSTTQRIAHVKIYRDDVSVLDEDITPSLTYNYVCDNVVADTEVRFEFVSENGCKANTNYTINVYKVDVVVSGAITTCNNTTTSVSWSADVTAVPVAADSYTYDFVFYDSDNNEKFSVAGSTSEDFVLTASQVQTLAEGNYKIVATAHANFGATICSGTSEPFNVKVLAKPDNTLTSNMPTCIGDEITFEAVAGYDLYVFYVNDAVVQSNTSNTFKSSTLTTGDRVYVKITSASCEETSSELNVSYLDEFNPTVSADKTLICKDTKATFTCISTTQLISNVVVYVNDVVAANETLSPSAVSYVWSTDNLDSDVRVRFEFTSENGCKASSAETTVEVSQINVGALDGAATSCRGGEATYTISGSSDFHGSVDNFIANPSDYTYSYSLTIDGVAQPNPSSTSSSVDLTFAVAGVYELTATLTEISTGCSSSVVKTINVVELPSFTVTSSFTKSGDGKYYVCSEQNFDLTVNGGMTGDKLNFESGSHGKLTFDVNVPSSVTTTDDNVVLSYDGAGKFLFVYADAAKNVDDTWSITLEGGTTNCISEVTEITIHNYAPIELSVPAPYAISGNTLQLCLGNTATISASSLSDDADPSYTFSLDGVTKASGVSFDVTGTTVGSHTLTVTHENGCSVDLTIITLNAPDPDASVEIYDASTDTYSPAPVNASYYDVCSSDMLRLTATGASAYTLTVDRDGNDVTSMFTASSTDATFTQNLSLPYDEATAGGKDYSTYTLTYNMSVGTCYDSKVVVVRSYVMPEITLTASATTAIEGDDIVFTVTPNTYAKYEFYLNNTKVSTDDAQATYTLNNIANDTTMVVVVTNAYGCSVTKEISVVVLDEILPRDVLTSADYYCEGSGPITISVENPQVGVTYVLNNCASCSPIQCTAANPTVEWEVLIDAGTPISGVNGVSQTYNVTAYYTQLPALVIDMNNTVTISEYVLPDGTKQITPYNQTYSDCYTSDARIIKVPNSEVNVRYYLMYDADFDGSYEMEMGPIKGNGSTLIFKAPDKVGQYKVVAYQFDIANGGLLCPVDLDGYVKVEIPNLTTFTAYSNPANGNFCTTGDGVDIILNGSETDVVYYLIHNGDYIVSGTDTVKLSGTGSPITFEKVKVAGTYSIMSLNKGCLVPMSGSVELTEFEAPIDYDFTATNEGFYCYDVPGVELTVSGQQDGYLYTLYRNGIELFSTLGDNSGAPLILSDTITVNAEYTVRVSIPSVAGGCDLWLTDTVKVRSKEPSDLTAIVLGDNSETEYVACEGETVNLRLLGTEPGSRYQLVTFASSGVMMTYGILQTATDNYLDFAINQDVGSVTFGVILEKDYFNDNGMFALTCARTSVHTAKLVVVNSVGAGSEIVSHETPAGVTDECYGEDIIITGAQSSYQIDDVNVDYSYTLYRYENLTGDNNTGNVANYQKVITNNSPFVASGNAALDRFTDIRDNNGTYMIQVSNGYCSDWLPAIINITSTKYVEKQTVIAETEICHGDAGDVVTLAATELGVTYTLYRVVGTDGVDDDDIRISKPYTATSTAAYTFVDDNDRDIRITQSGTYYVVGVNSTSLTPCPIHMGDFEFASHALPNSYQLVGKEDYCGTETGVVLTLANSDVNTTYTLYKVTYSGSEPTLEAISTVIGTGDEIAFSEVSAGTYTATAINKYGCTSSMDGVIEVTNSPIIDPVNAMSDITVCDNNFAPVVYSASNMVSGLTYYLVRGSVNPENDEDAILAKIKADGTSDLVQNVYEDGQYTIWASYDYFACMQLVDQFNVTINEIRDHVLISDASCDGTMTVRLETADAGVDYEVVFVLNNGTITPRYSLDENYSYTYENGLDVEYALAYAVTPNGCNVQMSDTAFARVHTPIPAPSEMVADASICNGSAAHMTYSSANMVAGVTYYIVRGNVSPDLNSAEILSQTVADGTSDFEFDITEEGVYTVWASYDSFDCLQRQDEFNVVSEVANNYNSYTASSCDGKMKVYLNEHDDDVVYQVDFVLNDGSVFSSVLDANYSYTYDDIESVNYATVYAITPNGCKVQMGANVKPHVIETVTGEIAFYVNGTPVAEGDVAEVCVGSTVSIIGSSSVQASSYIFRIVTDSVNATMQSDKNNIYMPKTYELKEIGEKCGYDSIINVVLDVVAGDCSADSVASFKFKITNPILEGTRLFALADTSEMRKVRFDGDTVHVHYCEGDFGVKLYYSRAVKNEIYRLYKQADSTMIADEIQDIQEVPLYSEYDVIENLYFDGWGFNAGDTLNYAGAGTYYVEILDEATGCSYRTNTVTIIMDPSPIDTTNVVYYEFISDYGKGAWHPDTKNYQYGIIGGAVVLEAPRAGVTYQLINDDKGIMVQEKTIADKDAEHNAIHFDTISVEGTYYIRAIDNETGCDDIPGSIEFIEDELITYDVYLFLSQSTNIVYQNLVPNFGSKGNHKYLDWSSKIDVVWQPVVNDTLKTQGAPELGYDGDEEYEKYIADARGNKTGYTALEDKANIEFHFAPSINIQKKIESIQVVTDTVTVVGTAQTKYFTTSLDTVTTALDDSVIKCDSVANADGSYTYSKTYVNAEETITEDLPSDVVGIIATPKTETSYSYSMLVLTTDTTWLLAREENCDSISVPGEVTYQYLSRNDTTYSYIQVKDSIYGEYGFYNLNSSELETSKSKSGWFKYTRRPRFYGMEVIPYYAVNTLMPSIRTSNTSNIYVLCGNEDTGIDGKVFLIPNAFSPNGDGYNDTYEIVMPKDLDYGNTRLKVFNRWGTLVYESSGTQYGVDCPYWDGTSSTSNMVTVGTHLPSGTYFYVFQIDFTSDETAETVHKELNGYIELRR